MTLKINRYIWLGAAVAILQSGALYAMVAQRASILRSGTDITLLTEPVDPHDLLRGDYVTLGYGISNVEAGKVSGTPPIADGPMDIYVTVKQGDDGAWMLSEASWQKREGLPDGEVQLRGRTPALTMQPPTVSFASLMASSVTTYRKARGWQSKASSASARSRQ